MSLGALKLRPEVTKIYKYTSRKYSLMPQDVCETNPLSDVERKMQNWIENVKRYTAKKVKNTHRKYVGKYTSISCLEVRKIFWIPEAHPERLKRFFLKISKETFPELQYNRYINSSSKWNVRSWRFMHIYFCHKSP